MLEFKNVCKEYGNGRKALNNVSFSLNEGEIIAVIGSSGAGKSTLLKCINRLIDFEAGKILFSGQDIKPASKKNLRKIRSSIGMIFQNYNLVERLTVIENVLHGALGRMNALRGVMGLYSEEEKLAAFKLLEETELSDFAYERCRDLSGGQKQRVGISRALMQNPKLLLCDEPVSSLDPKSSVNILNLIRDSVRSRNLSCIINLHQIDFAKEYADRIIALKNGEIVFDGAPEKLTSNLISEKIFSSGCA